MFVNGQCRFVWTEFPLKLNISIIRSLMHRFWLFVFLNLIILSFFGVSMPQESSFVGHDIRTLRESNCLMECSFKKMGDTRLIAQQRDLQLNVQMKCVHFLVFAFEEEFVHIRSNDPNLLALLCAQHSLAQKCYREICSTWWKFTNKRPDYAKLSINAKAFEKLLKAFPWSLARKHFSIRL